MAGSSGAQKRLVLILLCVVDFMIALDFSIVNVALPIIKSAFGFSPATMQWVVSAYALTFGGFLILGGRVADVYGRRRVLIAGLIWFSAASLVAGLAQNAQMLVIMRGAQGLGAAVIAPSALSLLTTTFVAQEERRRALSAWGAVLGAGFVCGVILGGILTQYLGWRWVLLVNAPIAAVLAALCPLTLPPGDNPGPRRRLDIPGAFLVTAGVTAVVYAVSEANAVGWLSAQTLGVAAGAVVLLAAFVVVEAHTAEPVIPLRIFRLRSVVVSNSTNLLLMGSYVGVVFVLTLFLQEVRGFSPVRTGLAFALAGVAGFTGGIVAGKLAGLTGVRIALTASALIQAGATFALLTLPQTNTMLIIAALTVVLNFSDVIAIVMISIGATSDISVENQGLAGGLVTATQQVGAALGLSVIAAIVTAKTAAPAVGIASTAALLHGFRWGLTVAGAVCVAGALLALAAMRTPAIPAATPEQAVPEQAVPEQAVPQQAIPEQAVPETARSRK
jgi:EmrB/QacA subfamily drug resistance transporter